jgi:arylsulfatase A-like enzyme
VLVFVATAVSNCGRQADDEGIQLDLIAGFPMAEVWSETRHIDLGTPRSRRHLVSGWSDSRWDKNRKIGYRLADDDEAVLRFTILDPRILTFRAYGRPRDTESVTGEVLQVSVNGNSAAQWAVEPQNKRYRARLPEGLLVPGENEVSLKFRNESEEPVDSNSGMAPAQSMIWYSVDIEGRNEEEPPRAQMLGDQASILIPWGTRLEYYLELPADARILLDEVKFLGSSSGALEIGIQSDGTSQQRVGIVDSPAEKLELPLTTDDTAGIVRLTLRAAEREAVSSDRSGVIVVRPTIRASLGSGVDRPGGSAATPARSRGQGPREGRNVLLYVVDTLRADHLGMYGYERPVSPNMDRFAENATIFDNAIAQSSWTRSSMASMFTGMWPVRHDTNGRKDKLAADALTLAEVLNQAGVETTAIARNWNIFPTFGFAQGFDRFRALKRGNSIQVNESVQYWFENRDATKPFFLYLHTVDPHGPYRPPERFRKKFTPEGVEPLDLDKHPGHKRTKAMTEEEKQRVAQHLINLYDGEIASNDSTFGLLLEMFEARDLMKDTLIVVASDHGEEFLEHGTWEHGKNLFAENLDVPLIIRFPEGGHGLRIQQVVQHIDIMPTILDWLGLPVPDSVEGSSLLPLIDSPESTAGSARPAFSYLELDGLPTQSVIIGEWKYIERVRGGKVIWSGLFNRRTDPGDRTNQFEEYPIRSRYMSMLLDARIREGRLLKTIEAELDAETENALRALGYLK